MWSHVDCPILLRPLSKGRGVDSRLESMTQTTLDQSLLTDKSYGHKYNCHCRSSRFHEAFLRMVGVVMNVDHDSQAAVRRAE